MSLSNIKIMAETKLLLNPDLVPIFRTNYKPILPVGGHTDGEVETFVEGHTETSFNLWMAQACADRCNLESSNLEEFVATDVIGGRI